MATCLTAAGSLARPKFRTRVGFRRLSAVHAHAPALAFEVASEKHRDNLHAAMRVDEGILS